MKALIYCDMEHIGRSMSGGETARMTWRIFGLPVLSYIREFK